MTPPTFCEDILSNTIKAKLDDKKLDLYWRDIQLIGQILAEPQLAGRKTKDLRTLQTKITREIERLNCLHTLYENGIVKW